MAEENETKIRDAAGLAGPESPVKSPVDVPDLSDGCSVYVITCEGRTKIGIAADPEERRLGLEMGSGLPMTLRAARRFGSRDIAGRIERELHAQFARNRHIGEWFDLAAEVAERALMDAPEPPRPAERKTPAEIIDDPADRHLDLALRHAEASAKGILLPEIAALWRQHGVYERNMARRWQRGAP